MRLRNPRAKGNKAVRKCMDLLKAGDYICDTVEKTGKFRKIKDMFGLFDITARHKLGQDTIVTDIQITCNKPHTHRNYADFAKEWSDNKYHIEQWVLVDRKGFIVFRYLSDGRITKFDNYTGESSIIRRYVK